VQAFSRVITAIFRILVLAAATLVLPDIDHSFLQRHAVLPFCVAAISLAMLDLPGGRWRFTASRPATLLSGWEWNSHATLRGWAITGVGAMIAFCVCRS